jgi:16S rRNA (cytidine1402-2'-O)-methyltransferase
LGNLYLVATPIGNLEDISLRALRILKQVDWIACEDTRHTARLLSHYGIEKPLISYHEHNETARAPELIARLAHGDLALVTDAGTPLVSDPGYRIVRAAVDAAIPVVPIPGPSAAILALSASGLPSDQFRFCGFLPARSGQRRHALQQLRSETATLVFYEAPHRILETLEDIHATLGPRNSVIARELTKLHEEFLRGTPGELLAELRRRPSVKGEITLLVARAAAPLESQESLGDAVARLQRSGIPRMDAIKQAARERGLSKRDAYSRLRK